MSEDRVWAVGTKADAKPEELRGTLPAGTRLRNYELISVLGHGGFGITYYARDTTLGREVAVKEYLPTSLALRENGTTVVPRSTQLAEDFIWGRERFLEEARILATLEGVPSIVRVYDYLEANGTAYMVMGLARGETLDQRLKRDKQLAPAVIERMLERLLGGLEEVHKAGFLHRDVKPANIILDAKDNPTLIDFGASRAAMADRTAAMTAIFTPRYAAAEQLTSDKQGPWTDIYSVSATLYHSITGRAPPSSLERALNDTYEPLAGLSLAGFSAGTLPGIDAGLALRAKDRPQSIAVWRDVLSSTDASDGDATVVRRVKPGAVPKPPGPAPETPGPVPHTAAPPAPPSAGSEPSQLLAIAGKNRIKLYAGVMVAILILAVGGYLVFATKSAPSPTPFGDQKADGRDEAAKAAGRAAAGRASDQAKSRSRGESEGGGRSSAEGCCRSPTESRRRSPPESRRRSPAKGRCRGSAESRCRSPAESRGRSSAEGRCRSPTESSRPKPSRRPPPRLSRKLMPQPSRKPRPKLSRRPLPKPNRKQPPRPAEGCCRSPAESRCRGPAESRGRSSAEGRRRGAAEGCRRSPAEGRRRGAAESRCRGPAEGRCRSPAEGRRRGAAESGRRCRRLKRQRRLPKRHCDSHQPTASGFKWR